MQQVLTSWEDGRIKLYMTYKALHASSSYRDVFLDRQYIPLQVAGQRQEHIYAFIRCKDGVWALAVIPRLLTKLVQVGTIPMGRGVWGDDLLLLPKGTPEHWLNIFTGENLKVSAPGNRLSLSDILSILPAVLLIGI